jgi:hypothetical protein
MFARDAEPELNPAEGFAPDDRLRSADLETGNLASPLPNDDDVGQNHS